MGLIETLRKCIEQRSRARQQQLLDETEEERRASILRRRMRVYPSRSRASQTETDSTSCAVLPTDEQSAWTPGLLCDSDSANSKTGERAYTPVPLPSTEYLFPPPTPPEHNVDISEPPAPQLRVIQPRHQQQPANSSPSKCRCQYCDVAY